MKRETEGEVGKKMTADGDVVDELLNAFDARLLRRDSDIGTSCSSNRIRVQANRKRMDEALNGTPCFDELSPPIVHSLFTRIVRRNDDGFMTR